MVMYHPPIILFSTLEALVEWHGVPSCWERFKQLERLSTYSCPMRFLTGVSHSSVAPTIPSTQYRAAFFRRDQDLLWLDWQRGICYRYYISYGIMGKWILSCVSRKTLKPPHITGPPRKLLPCHNEATACWNWKQLLRLLTQNHTHQETGRHVTRPSPHVPQLQIQGLHKCSGSAEPNHIQSLALGEAGRRHFKFVVSAVGKTCWTGLKEILSM